MSGRIDKTELIKKLRDLEGLTDEEKSNLIGLVRQHKKYGLVWEDKPEDVEERLREELPVLTEVKERRIISDAPDTPNHILIEGDNLEALTALSYTHEGKIDVIYIDPPYNTGNKDFAYYDDFCDEYRTIPYVEREDAFRHSKWLSFMSKRLRIAKRLLSDKGVIFISIDDNEQANLKLLCDEVFGSSNYIATLPTIMNLKGNQDEYGFAGTHEYTIVYSKFPLQPIFNQLPIDDESYYEWQMDDVGFYKRGANLKSTGVNAPRAKRPNLFFPIYVSNSGMYSVDNKIEDSVEVYPITDGQEMSWRWSKDKFRSSSNDVIVVQERGAVSLYKKQRPELGDLPSKKPKSIFYKPEYSSGNGTAQLKAIFGDKVFNNPKPIDLLMDFVRISASKNSIILDFFAGSGTTLHATMQLNAEDGGHRQCILVTNNENGICEQVTYERNKRVIQGYITPKGQQVEGLHNNNLRYYRTDFMPRERTQRNMRALVNAATDLLCIKEDLYQEKPMLGTLKLKPQLARYFSDGQKHMLIVYREEVVNELVEAIKPLELGSSILKIYIFSPGRYAFDDNFYEVQDKVQLVALPAAIYDAYQRVLPKQKERLLVEAEEPAPQPSASAMTIDFEEGGEQ